MKKYIPWFSGGPCQRIFNVTTPNSTVYNSSPLSAIVSDFNDDTQLDIVVANSGTDTVGIFLGNANGTFQSQLTYSTGYRSQPYSVVVGDFNSDNQPDIVAANYGTNSIGILIGYGDGTFAIVRLFSLGTSRPVSGAAADLNNDKHLDIILVNYDTSRIDILLGYGNAYFSIQARYSTGYDSHPCSIVVADLNKDNRLDLVISNSGTNNVAVFLSNSNGSFSLQKLYSTGVASHPSSVGVGDLNDDKHLDIIVSNEWASNVGVFIGYGDGTFAKIEISSIGFGYCPHSMVIGDFNEDHILDVAVANSANNTIFVLSGSGNGTFTNNEMYSTGSDSMPVFLISGDFNDDHRLDLAAINNGTNTIEVFLRYVMKTFANETKYQIEPSDSCSAVALGDFNNDSLLDIVAADIANNNVGIFLGYGDGTFREPIICSTGNDSQPTWVGVGNFNEDNLLDIVVANRLSDNVGLFFGYGNGTFRAQITLPTETGSHPQSIAVDDFNNDSILDIAVVNSYHFNVGIFLGYGNGHFRAQTTLPTGDGSYPMSVTVGDVNKDSLLDLVLANSGIDSMGLFLGNGNGTFGVQTIFSAGNGSSPRCVILGDFNNDSLLDVALANSDGDSVGIFLGYGNGSFERIVIYSMIGGSIPTSLILGDFNNDNILDIAVSNLGTNNVSLLFGQGSGTFGMISSYSTGVGSRPISIATGNLNGDIWLDIVVAHTGSDSVGVLLGSDNIDTANQASYSTGSGSHPFSVVTNDFNSDNLLDLLIVYSAHDDIGIRLGYGDGTFADDIIYPAEDGSSPRFATVGDFNNDDRMDIVIANIMTDSVTLAYGYGNGTFTNQNVYTTGVGSHPYFPAVGDLNNDNRLDLIVLNQGTNTVGIFLSFDYAIFRQNSSYPTWGSGPASIALGDFNNDSQPDLAIANYLSDTISILLRNGNGAFGMQHTLSTGLNSYPRSVVVSDFNNDSILDIAVANLMGDNVGVFLGYGNGTFGVQITFPTANTSWPYSIAVGDFNNDSLLDIVVANNGGNNIGILLGYGNGTFRKQITFPTGNNSTPNWVAIGDLNNDGRLDLAVANYLGNNVGILLGYGNGSFAQQTTYSTGDGFDTWMITIGDLNNDNMPDILVTNYGADSVGIFFGYGDGSFTSQMIFPTGIGSKPIAAAIWDFNSDNRSDIVVVNYNSDNVILLLRDSSQPFLTMTTFLTGKNSNLQYMAIADVNKDNFLDIIVANNGNDNIGIFLGYGNGSLMKQITYATGNGSSPSSVAVGDFNNDSLADIAVANTGANNVGILLGYGNGTFSAITSYSTGNVSNPYSVSVADFNNDKCLDMAVSNLGSKSVQVLYGYCNGTFGDSKSYSLGYTSISYSVTVGDFNRDTWLDIAAANYGTDSVEIFLQACNTKL
ncbi:unnamed protein product [Rotaria socialis]|uniref:Uncharacterized protein n=1 Tax=Rotaria socialis TaxID=392032 RepID=A0A817TEH0_9BILA|nr:unnamed protein product [Rotaria socialis]CAF4611845.1 unnamed protein product [Rotaria socialis]